MTHTLYSCFVAPALFWLQVALALGKQVADVIAQVAHVSAQSAWQDMSLLL